MMTGIPPIPGQRRMENLSVTTIGTTFALIED